MPNNAEERVYAGFFVRLAAYLIDWIIVGTALMVIRIPVWIAYMGGVDFVLRDFIFSYSVYDIVLYVLKVVYFVLLTYYTGATLGKKLLHIRVISNENRKPTFFEILFRESVGKFLSGLILEIGYLMIGLEKNKCGLHDILSDTYVVYQHQKVVAVPTPVMYQPVAYNVPVNQMPPYTGNGDNAPANQTPPYAGSGDNAPVNQMPSYTDNGNNASVNQTPPYTGTGNVPFQNPNEMPPAKEITNEMPSPEEIKPL